MKLEFPLAQAAHRAELDERTFRHLADRRIIFATPETRSTGRGKLKLYSEAEVFIAALLAPFVKLGASQHDLAHIADSLRSHVSELMRSDETTYIKLMYRGPESWGWSIETARSPYNGAPATFVSATEPNGDGSLASELILIRVLPKLRGVRFDEIDAYRNRLGLSPSQLFKSLTEGGFPHRSGHTEAEWRALLNEAEEASKDGDEWPEVAE
jgi:hypothetical protein